MSCTQVFLLSGDDNSASICAACLQESSIWTSELVVFIVSLYLTFNTHNFSSSLKCVKLLLYKPLNSAD